MKKFIGFIFVLALIASAVPAHAIVSLYHPVDTNHDFVISFAEINSYLNSSASRSEKEKVAQLFLDALNSGKPYYYWNNTTQVWSVSATRPAPIASQEPGKDTNQPTKITAGDVYHPVDTNRDFTISFAEIDVYLSSQASRSEKEKVANLFLLLLTSGKPYYYWNTSTQQWDTTITRPSHTGGMNVGTENTQIGVVQPVSPINIPTGSKATYPVARVISSTARVVVPTIGDGGTGEDAQIVASYIVDISAGATDVELNQVNVVAFTSDPHSYTSALSYRHSVTFSVEGGGAVVPANTTKRVTIYAYFNTRYMFSGLYYVKLSCLTRTFNSRDASCIPIVEGDAVTFKAVSILGEKFAQIFQASGLVDPLRPGSTIIITGDRFNKGTNSVYFVYRNGSQWVDITKISGYSSDGKVIRVNLPDAKTLGSEKFIGVQVQNPNTPTSAYYNYGRSNIYIFELYGGIIPPDNQPSVSVSPSSLSISDYFSVTWGGFSKIGVDVYLHFSDGGTCLLSKDIPLGTGSRKYMLDNYRCPNIPQTVLPGTYRILTYDANGDESKKAESKEFRLLSSLTTTPTPVPTISSLQPSTVKPGGIVQINGSNFTADSLVYIDDGTGPGGGLILPPTSLTSTSLTITARTSIVGPHNLYVHNVAGTSSPVTLTISSPASLAPTFRYDQKSIYHRLFIDFGSNGGRIKSITQVSPTGTCHSLGVAVGQGVPNCSLGNTSYVANSSCGVYLQMKSNTCRIKVDYYSGLSTRTAEFESYLPAGNTAGSGERIRQVSGDSASITTHNQTAALFGVIQALVNFLSGR